MDEISTVSQWVSLHRKLVTSLGAVLVIILIALRIFVIGEWDQAGHFQYEAFARNLADGLLSTVVVSGILAISSGG